MHKSNYLKRGMYVCGGILCFLIGIGSLYAMGQAGRLKGVPTATATDGQFLDVVQYHLVQYFLNESNKKTGLVKDRASNFGTDNYTSASISAVGFALPAYVIGAERGWIRKSEAKERILNSLRFFRDHMEHKNGFYYHFVDMNTGQRVGYSEISSIDTALFLAGVMFVRQYYPKGQIAKIATQLYERVDWQWMLNNGQTFTMGWRPRVKGGRFLRARWHDYNECMILYLLGIGAPMQPVSPTVWHNINRPIGRYGEHILILSPPLFTHQYSHAFIDFRDKHDAYADYFQNSLAATLANREFCIDHASQFKTYGDLVWGLTACDGPGGYKAYGAKPGNAHHDGTVAPSAAGASIVFTPRVAIQTLRYIYDNCKDRLWGHYGFAGSFNLHEDWFATDVIGIDVGNMLLMIENYRSGLIWKYVMKNSELQYALQQVGFRKGSRTLTMPEEVVMPARYRKRNIFIDGNLNEWEGLEPLQFKGRTYLEYGTIDNPADFGARLYFLWDEEYLYVAAAVTDDDIVSRKGGAAIYRNDCLELYFDPEDNGFLRGHGRDRQIGLSPDIRSECNTGKAWSWLLNRDPRKHNDVHLMAGVTDKGYTLEAAIQWSYIGYKPAYNSKVRMSPAFHDADDDDDTEAKLNVFFQDVTGKDARKKLGFLWLIGKKF